MTNRSQTNVAAASQANLTDMPGSLVPRRPERGGAAYALPFSLVAVGAVSTTNLSRPAPLKLGPLIM